MLISRTFMLGNEEIEKLTEDAKTEKRSLSSMLRVMIQKYGDDSNGQKR